MHVLRPRPTQLILGRYTPRARTPSSSPASLTPSRRLPPPPQAGKDRYDTTALSKTIVSNFNRQVFEQDMEFVFAFQGETSEVKFKGTIMKMTSLGAAGTADDGKDILVGVLSEQTKLTFTVPGTSNVTLAGSGGGASSQKSLFDQGWKFDDMGIGGLGGQFQEMFRRAFVSRIFPPEVVEKLGIVHCKGIMLYGPPGTGKTLMARQIGKMLNGMDPKVVNGPEIMSKYVGESEENVRKLFIDAEQEQLERGENSQLHVIIFDEIDAICKERGSTGGGTGVADSVVNQLLSKIDGVEALTNVLLIGMTNRLDMIDEALLRPGRFELKLQIGLPDEEGRVEIFKIHTKKLVDNKYLDDLSIIPQLAARAKNFSGAEIAGLIRAAVSYATNRCMKDDSPTEIDQRKLAQLKVSDDDFNLAFADVIPAFGSQQDEFVKSGDDIVEWDLNVDVILKTGKLLVQQAAQSTRTPLVSCLLAGPPGAGKTSLAARIAQNSEFPFIKLITPDKLVGLGTAHKISRIKKVFEDAYKSVNSVVVVDDIERLIEFVEIGNRFSNDILQALLVLIKKAPPPGHHMLIVATTSNYEVMRNMGLAAQFSKVQHVNYVEQAEQVLKVVQECAKFDADTTQKIAAGMDGRTVAYSAYDAVPICIGIKKVRARQPPCAATRASPPFLSLSLSLSLSVSPSFFLYGHARRMDGATARAHYCRCGSSWPRVCCHARRYMGFRKWPSRPTTLPTRSSTRSTLSARKIGRPTTEEGAAWRPAPRRVLGFAPAHGRGF